MFYYIRFLSVDWHTYFVWNVSFERKIGSSACVDNSGASSSRTSPRCLKNQCCRQTQPIYRMFFHTFRRSSFSKWNRLLVVICTGQVFPLREMMLDMLHNTLIVFSVNYIYIFTKKNLQTLHVYVQLIFFSVISYTHESK